MRTGRPTNDPKQEMLKIRVNAETKSLLEKESTKTNKSISEIVRIAIENYFEKYA